MKKIFDASVDTFPDAKNTTFADILRKTLAASAFLGICAALDARGDEGR